MRASILHIVYISFLMFLIEAELYPFPPPVTLPLTPPTHTQVDSLFFFDLLLLRHTHQEEKPSWY